MEISLFRKKTLKIFKSLQTPKNLEIGCGNGDFLIGLAKKYPELFFMGIDFSEEQIKLAKGYIEDCKNINYEFGNVLNLELKDNSFDTVFFINTFHHIKLEDQRKTLGELSRIAKENILLEIKNEGNFYYKYLRTGLGKHKAYFSLSHSNSSSEKIAVYPTTTSAVKNILNDYGFKLTKIKPLWLLSFLSPLIVLHFKRKQ